MDDGIRRWWLLLQRCVCIVLSFSVSPVVAEEWPAASPEWISRGAGGGLSLLLVFCWWLIALGWVFTTDWLSRDSVSRGYAPNLWGPLAAFLFVPVAIAAWWVPWAWASLLLTAAAWLLPQFVYVLIRNPKVPKSEKVLTVGHTKRVLAPLLEHLGVEIDTMEEGGDDLLPTVVVGMSADAAESDPSMMKKLKAAAGYLDACTAMQSAVLVRADKVRFDIAASAVHVRHHVDGVWVKPRVMTSAGSKREPEQWADVQPFSRSDGDAILVVLKAAAGVDPRAKGRQRGGFVIDVDGKSRQCKLVVQTIKTGEQVMVDIQNKPPSIATCADLGMGPELVENFTKILELSKGLLIVSSPHGSGLTTSFDIAINTADRLMRDFISLEDTAAPAAEIQNVKPVRYDTKQGQSAMEVLEKALLDYPAGVLARDLRDPALVAELVRVAEHEEKFVVISLTASDSIDAITKVQSCRVPLDQLGKSLLGSLSQRLVRRLCPRCKIAFQPPRELLVKLKKSPEEVPQLYRASQHGCRICGGLGYMGRTAIFEFSSGPTLRKYLSSKADLQKIRQAAIHDGMKSLRESGVAKVIEGVTSLEELQRVLSPVRAKQTVSGGKQK